MGAGPGSGTGAGRGHGETAQRVGAAAGGRCAAAGARAGGDFLARLRMAPKNPKASNWSKTVCPLPISEDFQMNLTQHLQSTCSSNKFLNGGRYGP